MIFLVYYIFSVVVLIQWTQSAPASDPLDEININLNLDEPEHHGAENLNGNNGEQGSGVNKEEWGWAGNDYNEVKNVGNDYGNAVGNVKDYGNALDYKNGNAWDYKNKVKNVGNVKDYGNAWDYGGYGGYGCCGGFGGGYGGGGVVKYGGVGGGYGGGYGSSVSVVGGHGGHGGLFYENGAKKKANDNAVIKTANY